MNVQNKTIIKTTTINNIIMNSNERLIEHLNETSDMPTILLILSILLILFVLNFIEEHRNNKNY